MKRIWFSVVGQPQGKGRPRAVARMMGDKPVATLYTPGDTADYERQIRDCFTATYGKMKPWTGPVMLKFTAFFPIPKAFNRKLHQAAAAGEVYFCGKPDKDNIEKAISDALNGVIWTDDAQVQGGGVKRYGGVPRLDIEIFLLEAPDIPMTPSEKARIKRRDNPPEPKPKQKPQPVKISGKRMSPRMRELVDAALKRDGNG